MGQFDFIKRLLTRPYTETGSGLSMEDPVKIIPRNLQSTAKRYESIAEKFAFYNPKDPTALRRAAVGLMTVHFKTKWLEARYGKEGEGFTYGNRTYHLNNCVEQVVIRPGHDSVSVFFDFSTFYEQN